MRRPGFTHPLRQNKGQPVSRTHGQLIICHFLLDLEPGYRSYPWTIPRGIVTFAQESNPSGCKCGYAQRTHLAIGLGVGPVDSDMYDTSTVEVDQQMPE